jgi:hypothetical protein
MPPHTSSTAPAGGRFDVPKKSLAKNDFEELSP